MIGLYSVIVSNDRVNRKIFVGLWLPGLIYGFCINLSSNQYFFAFSSVSLMMSIASIVIACRYIQNERNKLYTNPSDVKTRKWLAVLFSVLMVIQIGCELDFRYKKVFWDSEGVQEQTALIETGPDKGIRVSENKFDFYEKATIDLRGICSRPDVKKLLIVSNDCGLYLMAEKEFATYSAWFYGVDALTHYYVLFPDKMPDAVYITGDYYLQTIPIFQKNGYTVDQIDEEAETAILYPT
jgi:hypothetical protein